MSFPYIHESELRAAEAEHDHWLAGDFDCGVPMNEMTYGITETSFNVWSVREFRDGTFVRTVAAGMSKPEAQRIRDEYIALAFDTASLPNRKD